MMFVLPVLVIVVIVKVILHAIQHYQDLHFGKLLETVQNFSTHQSYSFQKLPLYTSAGLRGLRAALPRGLPYSYGQPRIPMYTLSQEHRAMYRPVFILDASAVGKFSKMFILPLYADYQKNVKGVCYAVVEIPQTNHWLKVETDPGLMGIAKDHDLESRVFNKKYHLSGSDRKLLTEVFDPQLIDQFSKYKGGSLYVRIRPGFSEVAMQGILNQEFFSETQSILELVTKRFSRVYPSHPEPKEAPTQIA
jgi:hypothetical protein